jgi:predicted dithiol-disulfide oxidoreductase (DUF899 family)
MPAVHGFIDRNENTGKDEIFIDTTSTNPITNKSVSEAFGQHDKLIVDSTATESTKDWSNCNSCYSITDDINEVKSELDKLKEDVDSTKTATKKKKIKRIRISFSSK